MDVQFKIGTNRRLSMSNYAPINESIRLNVVTEASPEIRSALATFCRRNGFPYLFFESLEPILSRTELILAMAVTERPWPPKGIGSITIEALGIAMVGSEGRAYLTPVLTDFRHATNLGLSSAVTKQLLEHLRERKVTTGGYLVRQGERALGQMLEKVGFRKSDLLVATEFDEYIEYSATPEKILDGLGLNSLRLGNLLALELDANEIDRLAGYEFTLSAGLVPFLIDGFRYAALLPGLIDVIAVSPPGGVPPGSKAPIHGGGFETE
jgi:hypothetical protein